MLHTLYQESRPYGFRQDDFFLLFTMLAHVKHVTPGRGHFLAPGA